jgi:hypothetical protein
VLLREHKKKGAFTSIERWNIRWQGGVARGRVAKERVLRMRGEKRRHRASKEGVSKGRVESDR